MYPALMGGRGVCRRDKRGFAGLRHGLIERLPCVASPIASPSASAPHWPPIPCSVHQRQFVVGRVVRFQTYPLDNLLDSLFMTLHLQESLDLGQGKILPVTQCHQLIKCAQQLEGIAQDLALV